MALSRRKKIVFALIPAALLVVLALAAEIGLRLFAGRFADDPYLNLALSVSIFSEETGDDGKRYYRVSHPAAYSWRELRFPIDKEPGTLRVFCLGGSACAGYPHPADQDFADELQFALQHAWPDRKVEVFNVAAQGFASYRVRDVFDDVIEFDPDLVVLYSGNNEFLEKRTYFGTPRTFIEHSHLIRFLGVALGKWLTPENSLSAWGLSRDVEVNMVLDKIEQQALELRRDDAQFRKVKEHYGYSIDAICKKAQARGVQVAALTVPSNLRDWRPNVSFHELDVATESRWRAHYDAGENALNKGALPRAIEELRAARTLSPQHARTAFLLARALDRSGAAAAAATVYRAAKEADFNPFRALDALNDTVRDIASRYETTTLVDAVAAFDTAAALPSAPGFDLFLDYVHPNVFGNRLLARTIFARVLADKMFDATPTETTFAVRETGYDEDHDLHMQHDLVLLAITQHQYETVVERSERALATIAAGDGKLGMRPSVHEKGLQHYVDVFTRARDVHLAYLAADRARLAGEPFDPDYRRALEQTYPGFFPDIFRDAKRRNSEKD